MVFRRFLQAGRRKLTLRKSDTSRTNVNGTRNGGDEGAAGGGRRKKGRRSIDAELRGKSRLSMDENVQANNSVETAKGAAAAGIEGIGEIGNTNGRRVGSEKGVGTGRRGGPIEGGGSASGSASGSAAVENGGAKERRITRKMSERGESGSDNTPARITKRSTSMRKEESSTSSSSTPRKVRTPRRTTSGYDNMGEAAASSASAKVSPEIPARLQAPTPKKLRKTSAGAILVEEPIIRTIRRSTSSGRTNARSINNTDMTRPSPQTVSRKRMSPGKKNAIKGSRRLSLDEAAVRGRMDSNRRTSRGISAELEGEAVRGMDVDPSHGLQKGLPLGEVSEAEKFRRLSLDGNLPEEARRPDAKPGKPEGEGIVKLGAQGGFGAGVQFGACSKAGWEPHRTGRGGMTSVEVRKENQDAYFVYAPFGQENEVLLGVFDGHGSNGRTVAQFVRDTLPEAMRDEQDKLEEYESNLHAVLQNGKVDPAKIPTVETNRMRVRALKAAFSRAERGLQGGEAAPCDHVFSGTTAVVAWIVDGMHIYTAWAGDSRCILGRKVTVTTKSANHGSDGMTRTKFKAVELSHDQKPMRGDEKKRVRQAGGRVARWRRNIGPLRVWLPRDWVPGLAMTRSIGDTVLSDFGVSPIPEVTYARLSHLDSFVVLASDGVWEFMNSDEVTDFVGRWRKEEKDPSDAAEALVREAVRRWRRQEVVVDDTTAVVVWLDGESTRVGRHAHSSVDGAPSLRENFKTRMEESISYSTKKKIWPFGRDKREDKDKVVLIRDDGRFTTFNCRNDVLVA